MTDKHHSVKIVTALAVSTIIFYARFSYGKEKILDEYFLSSEESLITSCEDSGCYVTLNNPTFNDFYAYCGEGNSCLHGPVSTEEKFLWQKLPVQHVDLSE